MHVSPLKHGALEYEPLPSKPGMPTKRSLNDFGVRCTKCTCCDTA